MTGHLRTVACAWTAALLLAAPARADYYHPTDLGTVGGGDFSFGFAINDAGQVTGQASNALGQRHAFLAKSSGGLTDLGGLSEGGSSIGLAINASGRVAGSGHLKTAGGFVTRAFVTGPDGAGPKALGVLSGGTFSEATGINAGGTVVGRADNALGVTRAFSSTGAELIDLGGFWALGRSEANGINNRGQIVGSAGLMSGATHAFRSDGAGPLLDLGALIPGGSSFGMAIGDDGSAAGFADAAGGTQHAFFYSEGRGMVDLGTLSGTVSSFGFGVNGQGQVVGSARGAGGETRAFSWTESDGMQDLNSLLEPGSGWFLATATGINNNGQITGKGFLNGQVRAFLLTPNGPGAAVPAPPALILLAIGGLAIGVADRARRGRRAG